MQTLGTARHEKMLFGGLWPVQLTSTLHMGSNLKLFEVVPSCSSRLFAPS